MAGLQLDEDPGFQRREWRVERIGWLLVTGAFLVALIGGFGYGPVSAVSLSAADAGVEYTRIVHRENDDDLHVRGPGTTIRLTGGWVQGVDLQAVMPQADSMAADPNGLTLTFAEAGLDVTISYRATGIGPLAGAVEVADQRFEIEQVVLP